MKILKILSLGLGIWAISLIWPEINQVLSVETMLIGVAGLGLILVGFLLMDHHSQLSMVNDSPSRRERPRRPPHDSHPIKPVSAI